MEKNKTILPTEFPNGCTIFTGKFVAIFIILQLISLFKDCMCL